MEPSIVLLAGIMLGSGGVLLAVRVLRREEARETPALPVRVEEVAGPAVDPSRRPIAVEIALGPAENPLLTVSLSPARYTTGEPIELPEGVKKDLAPLLAQAPRVLAVGAELVSAGTHVVMKFSPAVTRDLAQGSLDLVRSANMPGAFRATAAGPGGRFVENANLVRAANPAVVAMAVWQIAAMVTAQKFLADIDSKLSKISEDIDWLRDFNKDQELAGLRTDARRLAEMATVLSGARIKPGEIAILAQQAEAIDRDVHRTAERLLLSLERRPAGIGQRRWDTGWWNPSDDISVATTAISEVASDARKVAFAVRTRLLANAIRCGLGLASELGELRRQSVNDALVRAQCHLRDVRQLVADKLPALKAKFQWSSTDKEQQREFLAKTETLLDPRLSELAELQTWLQKLGKQSELSAADRNEPELISVELDASGSILSVARVLQEEAT